MKKLIIVIAVFSLMLSCKSTQNASSAQQNLQEEKTSIEHFIEGNKWELTNYNGKKPTDVGFAEDRLPSIVINEAENKVGGYSGCNSFGGQVDIDGDNIVFSKVFSTKMYCEGVPEQEFFQMLQQALKFKTKSKVLQLEKDGEVILEFTLKQNN